MFLTIIYHISKNKNTLEKSLDSIKNQTDQDFQLILVNDDASPEVEKIVLDSKILDSKKCIYIDFNHGLGHAISFNTAVEYSTGDYIFYTGSNAILREDFVSYLKKVSNNSDFLFFTTQDRDIKENIIEFDEYKEQLVLLLESTIKNKIFKREILTKNNIAFDDLHYYPLIFIFNYILKTKKRIYINEKLCSFEKKQDYSYNLYDVFSQIEELIKISKKYEFLDNIASSFEYILIYNAIYTFIYKMVQSHWDNKKTLVNALDFLNRWLSNNIPNWKNNEILQKGSCYLDDKKRLFVKNFKFNLRYIKKV